MDRFSRTIDTDTAEYANIEDSTPTKRGKLSKIIAIIVCFLLAVVMWLYVMEVNTENVEFTIDNVNYIENGVEADKKIVVKAVGQKNFIADAKRADVTVHGVSYNSNYTVIFTVNGETIEGEVVGQKTVDGTLILTVSKKATK
jgi:hypothetical protein